MDEAQEDQILRPRLRDGLTEWQMDLEPSRWPEEQEPFFRLYEQFRRKYATFPSFTQTKSFIENLYLNFVLHPQPTTKGQPTVKLRDVLRRQKAHGDSLREWQEDNFAKSHKEVKIREADLRNRGDRGVNRVPSNLRGLSVVPTPLVEHYGDNYRTRRARSVPIRSRTGKVVSRRTQPGTNQPYYNPLRADKKSRRR